jgi:hypothetical protein
MLQIKHFPETSILNIEYSPRGKPPGTPYYADKKIIKTAIRELKIIKIRPMITTSSPPRRKELSTTDRREQP